MQVLQEDRKYQRIRPSVTEKHALAQLGFQWTLSSFISAVGKDGNDLLIRFKNGSVYAYPSKANLFDAMVKSPSKGKYFHRHLIKASFVKGASMPLPNDILVDDDELIQDLKDDVTAKQTAHVKLPIKKEKIQLGNSLLDKIIIGGLVYYNFIL